MAYAQDLVISFNSRTSRNLGICGEETIKSYLPRLSRFIVEGLTKEQASMLRNDYVIISPNNPLYRFDNGFVVINLEELFKLELEEVREIILCYSEKYEKIFVVGGNRVGENVTYYNIIMLRYIRRYCEGKTNIKSPRISMEFIPGPIELEIAEFIESNAKILAGERVDETENKRYQELEERLKSYGLELFINNWKKQPNSAIELSNWIKGCKTQVGWRIDPVYHAFITAGDIDLEQVFRDEDCLTPEEKKFF